jgi:hypothetical protein
MKARREPLEIEVVHADDAVDVEAFLRLYVEAILAEARREDASENDTRLVEGRADETPTIPPERRFGLLAFLK